MQPSSLRRGPAHLLALAHVPLGRHPDPHPDLQGLTAGTTLASMLFLQPVRQVLSGTLVCCVLSGMFISRCPHGSLPHFFQVSVPISAAFPDLHLNLPPPLPSTSLFCFIFQHFSSSSAFYCLCLGWGGGRKRQGGCENPGHSDTDLDQGNGGRTGEKQSDKRYVLKVEPTGFGK